MSDQIIAEISRNRMVLKRAVSGMPMPPFNFVTPPEWRVGDQIKMYIKTNPYDVSYDEKGELVVETPPEPNNEWKREFYILRNLRTKDFVTVDFEWVEGFEELEAKYRAAKQKNAK